MIFLSDANFLYVIFGILIFEALFFNNSIEIFNLFIETLVANE